METKLIHKQKPTCRSFFQTKQENITASTQTKELKGLKQMFK